MNDFPQSPLPNEARDSNQLYALLLIDIQKGFEDLEYWGGRRNNPDAELKAGQLLTHWRQKGWPVFHAMHNSTNPNSPLVKGKVGNPIQDVVAPIDGEPVFEKNVNSAFIGTGLEELLRKQGIQRLVIAGMTTEHCISTSVRMAANLGYEVWLVADACACFDTIGPNGKLFPAQLIHEVELAALDGEFAKVVNLEHILKQMGVG